MVKMFCERLKKLRHDKELSQAKLANIIGMAPQTVNSWEQGQAQPSMEMLIRLANLFDVTIDYLVGASNDIIRPSRSPKNDTSGAYEGVNKRAAH